MKSLTDTNPQGKLFLKDENNKGKRLLEKMGWKLGQGLGKQQDGITEPVKPKVQSSTKGLGFQVKDDKWIGQVKSYEQVLESLHKTTSVETSVDVQAEQTTEAATESRGTKRQSTLESKSKTSRARIHYSKFVRNKDLSRATDNDMRGIFGDSIESASRR